MEFNLSEDLKMIQTLARDFVKDQLIPLEREVLGRESDLEGAQRRLSAGKESELSGIARDTGLWALNVPEHLGGAGLGVLAACLVEEELAKTVVPFDMGDVTPLLFECSEEQKNDYLLPVIEGKKTFYLALIEPGENIDLVSLKMGATRKNGGFILDGRKIAFTGKESADFAIVFAVTAPEKGYRDGVTCFLVDKGISGFTVEAEKTKSGWRAQAAEPVVLNFRGCEIAAGKILGEEGKAFRLGSEWLPLRRIVRSARCVGAAERLLSVSAEHARSWQTFGQTINAWPGIRRAIAEMATDIQAARLMVYHSACRADEGLDIRHEAAMTKVFATEMLERVANRAVLVRGGPSPAGELPLEILCRSLLVSHITERNLELQKTIIANRILG